MNNPQNKTKQIRKLALCEIGRPPKGKFTYIEVRLITLEVRSSIPTAAPNGEIMKVNLYLPKSMKIVETFALCLN